MVVPSQSGTSSFNNQNVYQNENAIMSLIYAYAYAMDTITVSVAYA